MRTVPEPTASSLTHSHRAADTSAPRVDLSIGALLRRAVDAAPDARALVAGTESAEGRRSWTYLALWTDATAVASSLLSRFAPGDRLALSAQNSPEWEIIQLGAALAGLTLVPLNTSYSAAELRYVLEQSAAAGLVHGGQHSIEQHAAALRTDLPALREVVDLAPGSWLWSAGAARDLPSVDPTSPAIIQYTSGTTGAPKGAVLTHSAIVSNGALTADRLGLKSGSVWLNPLPLYHVNGSVFFTLGTISQASTHLIGKFDPVLILDLVEEERATFFTGVPTLLMAMMEQPSFAGRDLSSLQLITTGGTTVPAELVSRIESTFGVKVVVIYGQTEAGGVIATTAPSDTLNVKSNTVGHPLPHVDCKVLDARDEIVPCGQVGEICVRGATVVREYFAMPGQPRAAIDDDGWLRTGDLGTMDHAGRLAVTGRLKDLIIRGGENIYPRDIEDVLGTHPDLRGVVVVGVPDHHYGEIVAAVVPEKPALVGDVGAWRSFAGEHLSHRKVPARWFLASALPMTASGKIRKFQVKEMISRGELRELETPGS